MENTRRYVKVVVAAGGTGGHLFPARALAIDLLEKNEGVEVLFIGAGLNRHPYFQDERFKSHEIKSATPYQKGLWQTLKACFSLLQGVCQCFKFFRTFRPDIVVGFGSFHSFPVLAAAKLRRIPIALFESNVIPGRVNRFCSGWAKVSAVQFPVAAKRLKGKTVGVHMPLLQSAQGICRQKAYQYYSLDENRPTLLVFGGSQGSGPINRYFCGALEKLLAREFEFQVIHIVGSAERAKKLREVYANYQIDAVVKPFEKNMRYAWCVADLSISRSGSATLAELVEFGVPSILIPFPYGTEDHQRMNAAFFAHEVEGAVEILEKELSSTLLAQTIADLFDPSSKKLTGMRKALDTYKEGQKGKKDLCSVILETLSRSCIQPL